MSCSSCMNSIVMPGISAANVARCSSMISSALRLRAEAGFSFTTMSPRFCSVAKRPSSAPVRRANPATSGVAATTASIRCTIRSVSGSDVPSGVQ
jgi:hypothetical protein